MTAAAGLATTYDLTVGTKVNMDEAIFTLSPIDLPLLGGVGSDGYPVLGSMPVDQIQFSWMNEDLLTPRALAAAVAITAATQVTLAAGDRYRFSTGDVIRVAIDGVISNELMRVTGYHATVTDLTVTRGYLGTTAAQIPIGGLLMGLGTALPEGSDPENFRHRDRTTANNYTQIFGPTKIAMSGTEQVIPRYGVPNEWERQLRNRMAESAIAREMAYIYGVASNDSATRIRTTAGMMALISTNNDVVSTQLTVSSIQANQALCYGFGGIPNVLAANPAALGDLNDLLNTSVIRTTREDAVRGRQPVIEVHTEYGVMTILRHRWIWKEHAVAWRVGQAVRRVLRPMQFERLAKTGDSDAAQFLCEEGLEFKGQQQAFKMTGLLSY